MWIRFQSLCNLRRLWHLAGATSCTAGRADNPAVPGSRARRHGLASDRVGTLSCDDIMPQMAGSTHSFIADDERTTTPIRGHSVVIHVRCDRTWLLACRLSLVLCAKPHLVAAVPTVPTRTNSAASFVSIVTASAAQTAAIVIIII